MSHSNSFDFDFDFAFANEAEWSPWGAGGAVARVVGAADGYYQMLVRADKGYKGDPHLHDHAEFSYVVEGSARHDGITLSTGDGYAAPAGSMHESFEALVDSTYLITFKL